MFSNLRLLSLIFVGLLKRHRKGIAKFVFFSVILFLISFIFLLKTFKIFYEKISSPILRPKIVEGVIGKPLVLNPLFAQSEAEVDITSLIFRGLTSLQPDGSVKPDLAESFSAENGKEYIFNLRKTIYWHDGKKFTADDVIYTIKVAMNPNLKSRYLDSFKEVTVEKLDDYSVKFILKEPFSPFPSVLRLGIIPQHISLKRFKPIGTGPFKVVSANNQKVVLTNNKLNLIFKLYPNLQLALTALQLGEIQALGGLGTQDLKQIENSPYLKIYTKRFNSRFVAIFFNTKAANLAERSVRIALSLATSKADVASKMGISGESITNSPIPKSSWVGDNFESKFEYNKEAAAQMLEKNGWKLEEGVRKKNGRELAVKITSIDNLDLLKIMSLIKEEWENLGIKVVTRSLTGNELKEKIIGSREFEVLISAQAVNPDPDQYVLWHSTQTELANITNLTSAKVDKALEDGRTFSDKEIRKNKYIEFQKLLADEAAAIFLYWANYNYVVDSRVSGISLNELLLPSDRFSSVDKWRIKRKII